MKVIRIIFLFFFTIVNIFAFKMEGITFNKSLNNGYKEFVLHNDGTKKVRYKVSVLPSGKEDVTDCIKIFPKIITIEPKSSQILKMFGDSNRKLEEKEYPFILKFEQIIIPTLVKGKDGVTSGNSALGLAPSIQMKGYGGEIDFSKALELTDIKFEKNKDGVLVFTGKLTNHSHGAVELGINLSNKDKSVITSKGLRGIEANSTMELKILADSFTNENQIKSIEFYDDTYKTIKEIIRE